MSNLIENSGVTASGVVISLRCGNPECQNIVAQGHMLGLGIFRVLDCCKCRRATEFESTPHGWVVRLLARREVAPRREVPVPRNLAPHAQPLNGIKR